MKFLFEFIEYLDLRFVQMMFIAGFLASLACGVIGTIVVVRRNVFIAGGIAHTTFGGIGIGYYIQDLGLKWFDPMFGAVLVAVGAAVFLGLEPVKRRFREDSTIGVLWVIGMAVGILFMNMVNWNEVTYVSPESILFGDILLIGNNDLYIMGALLVLIFGFVLFFFKDLEAMAFDEEFARITGIKVSRMNMALLVLIALTVTILIKVVGVVLILAMLTIPAAVSNLFTKKLSSMMITATLSGLAMTFIGIILSLEFDTPTGATIVIIMGVVFLLSLLGKAIYIKARSITRRI
ncbi:MAG: metal ABC transporter permease [Thermoplasmatota archaeon]